MKKIALQFYSSSNLGDDLFIKVFSEYFNDYQINLLVNPRCIPKNLGNNVKIHPYSLVNFLLAKLQEMCEFGSKMYNYLQQIHDFFLNMIKKRNNAFVYIGGSLFMQHFIGYEEINFSTSERPNFAINSKPQGNGNTFVIGANLGPVYFDDYWPEIKKLFMSYNHVCLRDFASYSMVKELSHVQYAPDILFMLPLPHVRPAGENVVISVMNISRFTNDNTIISAYYKCLSETAVYFSQKKIPVTLVSFCKWEGDESAIGALLKQIPDHSVISTCFYKDNMQTILDKFAAATYVIGSRFHSIILAISFGKPVFPIIYNCKTEHYLSDLNFRGKYAKLTDLPTIRLDDVIHNYQKQVITDCTDHIHFAKNQFWALQRFLDSNQEHSSKEFTSNLSRN